MFPMNPSLLSIFNALFRLKHFRVDLLTYFKWNFHWKWVSSHPWFQTLPGKGSLWAATWPCGIQNWSQHWFQCWSREQTGHHCQEIMGHCSGPSEADSYECVHHVDGWQFHLSVSSDDGWNDVHQAHSSSPFHPTKWALVFWILLPIQIFSPACLNIFPSIQNDWRTQCSCAKVCLLCGQSGWHRARNV